MRAERDRRYHQKLKAGLGTEAAIAYYKAHNARGLTKMGIKQPLMSEQLPEDAPAITNSPQIREVVLDINY